MMVDTLEPVNEMERHGNKGTDILSIPRSWVINIFIYYVRSVNRVMNFVFIIQ